MPLNLYHFYNTFLNISPETFSKHLQSISSATFCQKMVPHYMEQHTQPPPRNFMGELAAAKKCTT